MKVSLIAYTPDPEMVVAAAAKTCYTTKTIDELMDNLDEESAEQFIDMLGNIGHESPIEHASFTFAIEGVSRSLLAQITRHRIASYSVRSQRYVSEKAFGYVTPPEIAADPEALAIYQEAMAADQAAYDKIVASLTKRHTQTFLDEGMDPKKAKSAARKKAQEDARFVLPNACETQMVVTMNARSLLNFFRHRCCNRAQWEIRDLACQMLTLVREAAPHLFAHAGPPCLNGPCPEGSMSCGKMLEMREKYGRG
ncbi:MAG: FAD-dependent thymidylate synthase [Ruminococcaceae bacterium]|nr:FAD-dependent thymidylate synthase [Oscillospiraceae bacterium]